jgi:phosphate transporter
VRWDCLCLGIPPSKLTVLTFRFPNMTAIMMENEVGVRYLSVKDFLRTGIPASVVTFVVVVLVGYTLMRIVGF